MAKRQYQKWKSLLPRVEIFYAVKCCSELPFLRFLAELNASFDCASTWEVETVLNLGVDVSRIILANTIKSTSTLQFASDKNVSMMTFDSEEELKKIKKYSPNASFHVGSSVSDPSVYTEAVRNAYTVFEMGRSAGLDFRLLDIGGGFPGHDESGMDFEKTAEAVNCALNQYFPAENQIRIIAEPGTYLATSSYTSVLPVIGKRSNETTEEGLVYDDRKLTKVVPQFLYYVNDGIYGSLTGNIRQIPAMKPLRRMGLSCFHSYPSFVFGNTCDSYDVVYSNIALPELDIGDWLYLKNAGAYSFCIATDDNGRPHLARAVTAFLDANAVDRLPWPAMSPDSNPLEHIWDLIGQRVEWRNLTIHTGSIRHGVEAVITAQGGYTRY